MYMVLITLGRLKYTQLSQCPNLVPLRLMQILKKKLKRYKLAGTD